MRILLFIVTSTIAVFAQDWTAKRIVAITDYPSLAGAARISGDVVGHTVFLVDLPNTIQIIAPVAWAMI